MLIPREHGAYGQLLFPLLSALLIGHPSAGAYLLGAAAIAAFLGHESLLIVLGQRGSRAKREQGPDAKRSLALFGGFCVVTGLVALFVLPRAALEFLALPVALAACVAVVVFAHAERSTGGEILVAIALSSMSVPIALAGFVPVADAFTVFAVFAVVFVSATVSVRAMIARTKKSGGPSPLLAGVLTLLFLAVLALLSRAGRLAPVAAYAALPVCAVALGLSVAPPPARYLREIGWTLVGATTLTAAILVFALA